MSFASHFQMECRLTMKMNSLFLCLSLIVFVLMGCTTLKHPFYYRVESPEGGRGYIFGTIHLGVPIQEVPKEVTTQLKRSNPVNVEMDTSSPSALNVLPSSMITAFEEDIEKSPISKVAKILIEYEKSNGQSTLPPSFIGKERSPEAEAVKKTYQNWLNAIQEKKQTLPTDIKMSAAEFAPGENLKSKLSTEQWNHIVKLLTPLFFTEEIIESLHVETVFQFLIDLRYSEVEVTQYRADLLNPRWSMDRKFSELAKENNQKLLNLDSNTITTPACFAEWYSFQIKNILSKNGSQMLEEQIQMENAYRSGNLDQIQVLNDAFTNSNIRQCLLAERNKKWILKIEQQIKNSPNSNQYPFFAFGVAHLIGEDGILKMLQQKNYKIERIVPQ